MSSKSGPAEAFVAFHPADQAWATELIRFLKEHGIGVSSELDLLTGDQKLQQLEQALARARRIILVISPDAMADPLVDVTRQAALLRAMERGTLERITLPVVIHPAPLPPTLKTLAHCNLAGVDDATYHDQLSRLLAAIPEHRPQGDLLKPTVRLPLRPMPLNTDELWPSLLEVYGELTGDEDKTLWLARHAVKMGVVSKREVLESLMGDTAANFYLTRLGKREERAQRILEDMRELAPRLRYAPTYDETLEKLYALVLRDQSKEPAPKTGDSVPTPALSFDQQLTLYLPASREANRFVPIVGGQNRIKLDLALEQIYVPLRARLHRLLGEEGMAWSFDQASQGPSSPKRRTHRRKEAPPEVPGELAFESDVALEEAFITAAEYELRGCVILGDPGSGKTTLLKRLLVLCVERGSQALGLPAELIPVMLPLRYLRDLSKGLDCFIQDQLESNPNLALSKGFGRWLLERGRLLLLLDGLDEVANATDRIRVRSWIEQALKDRPDCYFAVTSRYTGYQGEARFAPSRFLELQVKPFADEQAQKFILQWHVTVERHLKGKTRQSQVSAEFAANSLWTRLGQLSGQSSYNAEKRLREMMGNPLLLTILCFVHQMEGDLPRDRALLYEACVKVLLEHWPLMRTPRGGEQESPPLPWKPHQARRLLQPVAWWLHQQKERTRARADELAPVLETALRSIKQNPDEARSFLETIRDQSGLLVGWDVDSFGFMHLSFQEHLTAQYVRNEYLNRNDQPLKMLLGHLGESWWREVTLLLMALEDSSMFEPFMRQLSREEGFVAHPELVSQCIEEASEISASPFLEVLSRGQAGSWWRVLLQDVTGWLLKKLKRSQYDAWQWDYAALQALRHMQDPRIEDTCLRLLRSKQGPIRSLARELLEARGVKLAPELKAGDVWIHKATGLEFVYVPPGNFQMGGTVHADEQPIHTVTFASGFWIGKYPVTNAQYAMFLKATGHPKPGSWSVSQFNGAEQPVVGVTWDDAIAYCQWVNKLLTLEADFPPLRPEVIRLPSEAEWEYAARGPKSWEYPWGNNPPTPELTNYDESKIGRTTPVGQYPKGASWVGALDMAGNVWEWCADAWSDNYQKTPGDGLLHLNSSESRRVIRGGCWGSDAVGVRSAYRSRGRPWYRFRYSGFRVLAAVHPGGGTR